MFILTNTFPSVITSLAARSRSPSSSACRAVAANRTIPTNHSRSACCLSVFG
ncbi:MAG: hypothetical protein SPL12_03305 [Bacteroidales bacterium]|nr:hypothetical protein [Bacteroidales bacterium]